MLLPIRFHFWPFQCVTLPEETLQVLCRLEGAGTLFVRKPLARGGYQPSVQRHPLDSRLVDETVAVFIGDQELNSSHGTNLQQLQGLCMKYTHSVPAKLQLTTVGNREISQRFP